MVLPNEDEKTDGTDPLDPCDYNPESISPWTLSAGRALTVIGDGNPKWELNPVSTGFATARDD